MKCDLILALDVPDEAQASLTLQRLGHDVRWVKIGLQLFTRHGPGLVSRVADLGYRIFLDLKLHDIPNTVASAIESLSDLPIELLTIHTSGGHEMMLAAEEARQEHCPMLTLLGVTVLTSLDTASLNETGVAGEASDHVLRLGRLAQSAGLGGLVCSPLELAILRRELGPELLLVTPGVRPAGSVANEQKRVLTPAEAARAGANYVVVGRPILRAENPGAAARAVVHELLSA